jgi:RNA polymerase sigma factor (TIGR02999 family)
MAETSEIQATPVASLLAEVRRGEPGALGRLFSLAYETLRGVARGQRRRLSNSETLTTTALVHEAYIKLVGSDCRDFNDRAHFLAVAATAMRQILIGHARRTNAAKRGSGARPASFEEIELALAGDIDFSPTKAEAVLALDRALEQLHRRSSRQSRIVEFRFFAGMSIEETAVALGISPATVKRDWSMAQAWLHREIRRDLG